MTAVSQGGVPAGLQGLCSRGKVCSCLTLQGWGTASTPGDLGEVPPHPCPALVSRKTLQRQRGPVR